MKLQSVATLEDRNRSTRLLMEMVRHKIFSLFDIQFILVTGRNREGDNVTYDFLLRNLSTYKEDFNALAECWGRDHPVLKPVAMAIVQIDVFNHNAKLGRLLPHRNVSDFCCDATNQSFVLTLAMEIAKSLGVEGNNDRT